MAIVHAWIVNYTIDTKTEFFNFSTHSNPNCRILQNKIDSGNTMVEPVPKHSEQYLQVYFLVHCDLICLVIFVYKDTYKKQFFDQNLRSFKFFEKTRLSTCIRTKHQFSQKLSLFYNTIMINHVKDFFFVIIPDT